MGIFSPLLAQLKAKYSLERKTPYESSIVDDWWEGRLDGRLIAFQERDPGMAVYVGKVEEITEIYLVRTAAGQFDLAAFPSGPFDIPQLRRPALRDGIPRLSSPVREVMIFESFRGLSLITDAAATLETIGADLKLAVAMIEALEASESG